jgi:hypothetical protein
MMASAQRYLGSSQVPIRGTERIDIVNHAPGDTTTANAIVGLIGAAY